MPLTHQYKNVTVVNSYWSSYKGEWFASNFQHLLRKKNAKLVKSLTHIPKLCRQFGSDSPWSQSHFSHTYLAGVTARSIRRGPAMEQTIALRCCEVAWPVFKWVLANCIISVRVGIAFAQPHTQSNPKIKKSQYWSRRCIFMFLQRSCSLFAESNVERRWFPYQRR